MRGTKLWAIVCLTICIAFLTSCMEREHEGEDIKRNFAEKHYGDFIVTIEADKSIYEANESIEIAATLKYIGNEEKITIDHRDTPFMFVVREHTRDISIKSELLDISEMTTLYRDQAITESFVKTGIHENDPFYERYFSEVGFPQGSYTMTTLLEFNYDSEPYLFPVSIDLFVE